MRLRLLLPTIIFAALAAPPAASADFLHTVLPGESLSSIAAADGLSVTQLAAANGLSPDAQLIVGSTIAIPGQTSTAAVPVPPASGAGASASPGDGDNDSDDPATITAPGAGASAPPGDGDNDSDDPAGVSTSPAGPVATAASPSYVVQPGDTLSAIAARAGTTVSELAAVNGLDAGAVLPAGDVLTLPQQGLAAAPPAQAPPVGSSVVGRMTWFGGPQDPNPQGAPASGLGWRSDGMAFYNTGSLGNHWLIHFPWGETLPMTQIDVGPAPWTGNLFDLAFSALPNTPYDAQSWPNPSVTGTYEGP